MVIPGITGAGALVRAATHLDDAADAVKAPGGRVAVCLAVIAIRAVGGRGARQAIQVVNVDGLLLVPFDRIQMNCLLR